MTRSTDLERADFTLDQIAGFVAVSEEGSFGRAAERLMMTQPPLSRQIQKLERSLGVTLFRRTGRGAELTSVGKAFLVEARRLLSQVDTTIASARRVSEGASGTVRLGVTLGGSLGLLGRWVRKAQTQLPDVDLILLDMVTGAQTQALHAGELDLGLLRGRPRHDLLESKLVHAETLMLAAPDQHPLIRQDTVLLADIAAQPLVTYEPTQARYFHELVVAVFRGARLTPRYVQSVSQITTVLALVAAGVGLAIVPESMARVRLAGVSYRQIADIPEDTVELHAAWRPQNDNAALAAFLAVVAD